MLPALREYQQEAIEGLRQSIATGHRAPILVSPTGSGKTRTSMEIIIRAVERGRWVLFLAPRRELIYQASRNLEIAGIRHGVIMAGEPVNRYAQVQVASFDTLWARRQKVLMPRADVVIVDECHLSIAETRSKLISSYPDAKIIGLTATPARGDGKGLGAIYDDLVISWDINRLTAEGYLAPAKYFVPSTPDLKGLKVAGGDYIERELAERMDKPKIVGDIVLHWFRHAPGKSTVVFCSGVRHSRHVCEEFLKHGVKAEHLDGETDLDERKAILARVESGETTVLTNCFVASYGLDIPRLECAVLARPTRNITLFLQTVGRVLRTFDGKDHAIIIDHAGAVAEHGLVTDFIPWSLDTDSTVRERRQKQQKERKEPKDITCSKCKYVFRKSRTCPACGHEMIPPGQPIPVHEADLQELDPSKLNRDTDWDEKVSFIRGLKGYAKAHGYKPGWVAHGYKTKFGVWPNDKRVKEAPPGPVTPEVTKWVTYLRIRAAKGHQRGIR
jgi:superfamily II DNA or RNA helicase